MLTLNQFRKYKPDKDIYENDNPNLLFDGLQLRTQSTNPKVSYLISTYNRHAQLSRSLECLARQDMADFEVLLADDGSTQNIAEYVKPFEKFIPIKVYTMPRSTWRSCPSLAFSRMVPEAKGKIIVVAHPEIMLPHNALSVAYNALCTQRDDCNYYTISGEEVYPKADFDKAKHKWVSLKCLFLEQTYQNIDSVDWHNDTNKLREVPGFWNDVGFSGRNNTWHLQKDAYPWWFFGATFKDDPIWEDMTVFETHGIIDMWMITYRRENGFVDITPKDLTCYHQAHLKTAPPCLDEN